MSQLSAVSPHGGLRYAYARSSLVRRGTPDAGERATSGTCEEDEMSEHERQRPDLMGGPEPDEEGTDLLGGPKPDNEDVLGGQHDDTEDLMGGPEPDEEGTDLLGGPEPDEAGTDILGGPEPG
jgi:hypothetical protein